jgi:glycerol-3-phosphate acyltransferase PlsY
MCPPSPGAGASANFRGDFLQERPMWGGGLVAVLGHGKSERAEFRGERAAFTAGTATALTTKQKRFHSKQTNGKRSRHHV